MTVVPGGAVPISDDRGVPVTQQSTESGCDKVCKHGHHCTGHTVPPLRVEVRTHVAVADDGQHRFWHGSAGWACVVLDAGQVSRMDVVVSS